MYQKRHLSVIRTEHREFQYTLLKENILPQSCDEEKCPSLDHHQIRDTDKVWKGGMEAEWGRGLTIRETDGHLVRPLAVLSRLGGGNVVHVWSQAAGRFCLRMVGEDGGTALRGRDLNAHQPVLPAAIANPRLYTRREVSIQQWHSKYLRIQENLGIYISQWLC